MLILSSEVGVLAQKWTYVEYNSHNPSPQTPPGDDGGSCSLCVSGAKGEKGEAGYRGKGGPPGRGGKPGDFGLEGVRGEDGVPGPFGNSGPTVSRKEEGRVQ